MKKLSLIIVLMLILILALAACTDGNIEKGGDEEGIGEQIEQAEATEEEVSAEGEISAIGDTQELGNSQESQQPQGPQEPQTPQLPEYDSLQDQAEDILHMILAKDYEGVAAQVHPVKGIRFSPEGEVNTQFDLMFAPEDLPGMLDDPIERTWGYYWGSGYYIHYTFADYHAYHFEFDDFTNPSQVGVNQLIGQGLLDPNIFPVYPNAEFVEFYNEWPHEYFDGVMNWRSLVMIFQPFEGRLYLVDLMNRFLTD